LDSQAINMNPIPEVSIAFGKSSKKDEFKETAVTRSGNLKLNLPNFFNKKRRSFDLEEHKNKNEKNEKKMIFKGEKNVVDKSRFQETSMCETDRHREAIKAARMNFKKPQNSQNNKSISGKKNRRKNRLKKFSNENSKIFLFDHKKSSRSQKRLRRKKDSKRNISASKMLNRTENSRGRSALKSERNFCKNNGIMKDQFQSYLQKMSRISKGQKNGSKKLRNSRSGKLFTKIIGGQKYSIISNKGRK